MPALSVAMIEAGTVSRNLTEDFDTFLRSHSQSDLRAKT